MSATDPATWSFAVFPYLKTSGPVTICGIVFRSTEDASGLNAEQAAQLREIAGMLFLQDNLRIRSASYAVVPFIDLDAAEEHLGPLSDAQALVAYAYSSPHEVLGEPMLSTEIASLVVLSPGLVPLTLLAPEHHVIPVEERTDLVVETKGPVRTVRGYTGLYNFRHYFWAARGSRIYPPVPHLPLNIGQNLVQIAHARSPFDLLSAMFAGPRSSVSARFATALRWCNASNARVGTEDAFMALAVAFEALLGLPRDNKTERFVDSISLLSGRLEGVAEWAREFYDARSAIVHGAGLPQRSTRLLARGRHVFRVCLGAAAMGASLAGRSHLDEKLTTNKERFRRICIELDREGVTPESLEGLELVVRAIEDFRHVREPDLQVKDILRVARLAAKATLADPSFSDPEAKASLERFAHVKETRDHYDELERLQELDHILFDPDADWSLSGGTVVALRLIKVAWDYLFMTYYALREARPPAPTPTARPDPE